MGVTSNIAAVLEFPRRGAPDLWSLSGPLVWCLRQADIHIFRHDVALVGEAMTFETDHGRIRVSAGRSDCGAPTLTISASAAMEGSREVARQICYQLSRRVLARYPTDTILWQPTCQLFAPTGFKWSVLRDVPRHMNETMRRAMLTGNTALA